MQCGHRRFRCAFLGGTGGDPHLKEFLLAYAARIFPCAAQEGMLAVQAPQRSCQLSPAFLLPGPA